MSAERESAAARATVRSGAARSAAEQGTDTDPVVLSELAYLNQVYEEKFGFRFVVFVNRRPKLTGWEEIIGSTGDVRVPLDPVGQAFVGGALWRATLARNLRARGRGDRGRGGAVLCCTAAKLMIIVPQLPVFVLFADHFPQLVRVFQ